MIVFITICIVCIICIFLNINNISLVLPIQVIRLLLYRYEVKIRMPTFIHVLLHINDFKMLWGSGQHIYIHDEIEEKYQYIYDTSFLHLMYIIYTLFRGTNKYTLYWTECYPNYVIKRLYLTEDKILCDDIVAINYKKEKNLGLCHNMVLNILTYMPMPVREECDAFFRFKLDTTRKIFNYPCIYTLFPCNIIPVHLNLTSFHCIRGSIREIPDGLEMNELIIEDNTIDFKIPTNLSIKRLRIYGIID